MIQLTHGRVRLALHRLRAAAGPPLLLLHELGGSSAMWRKRALDWPGAVYALDFCGQGESSWTRGGAYTAELLAADADAALEHLGSAVVAGAGLGAYVAMLLAAGRPDEVAAALLLPGRGLAGGGDQPDLTASKIAFLDAAVVADGCDPMTAFLDRDARPSSYVELVAPGARQLVLLEDGKDRPPWWQRLRSLPNVGSVETIEAGLAELARRAGDGRRGQAGVDMS